MKLARNLFVFLSLTLVLVACSKNKPTASAPVVLAMSSKQVEPQHVTNSLMTMSSLDEDRALRERVSKQKALISEVTLSKNSILNREFIYGADLQYSSIRDKDMAVGLQSIVLGHSIANFRIIGNRLQLVSDQRFLFESDVTHPERLIHEWNIIRQDEQSISVVIEKASPALVTLIGDMSAPQARTSWLRSLEFISEGNYLLAETTIEATDGSISEVMEYVFPRETIVPKDYKPLLNDSIYEELASRFRFLSNGKAFLNIEGERVQTALASRFNIKPSQTVDWYVNGNIPEEYMVDVKVAVEGWNRYSQAMWGKDMVRFLGKLPEGIKMGDPRYNVILWDNVAEAGAAYESQGSDILTGIQSHSLIYLPLAWVNIGKDYWNSGKFSEDDGAAKAGKIQKIAARRNFLGSKIPLHCIQDSMLKIDLSSRQTSEEFSHELLKGVLFHEMGHAMGLAHNFKASLSYDADDSHTMFSTSIMDYNQYNLEKFSFSNPSSSAGPMLEYDRQIISALYNEAKDIKDTDEVLPACNDEEADDYNDGVDPLCLRYDSGKDPTKALIRSISLITDANAKMGKTQSLPHALRDLLAENLGNASEVNEITAAKSAIANLNKHAEGVIRFYIGVSANSIRYMTTANLKNLYVHKEEILPEGYDAAEMRQRTMDAVSFIGNLNQLPVASQKALDEIIVTAQAWLLATPAIQSKSEAEREKLVLEILKNLKGLSKKLAVNNGDALFSKVRSRITAGLVKKATVPFYMNAKEKIDVEAFALAQLEKGITSQLNGEARNFAERKSAITALLTFADIAEGKVVISRVDTALKAELLFAVDSFERDQLRSLIKLLQ